MKTVGTRLAGEARALRAAYPDADALRGLPVSAIPPGLTGAACAALRHLRDEMLLVQSGLAGTLVVLDDELAIVDRHLLAE